LQKINKACLTNLVFIRARAKLFIKDTQLNALDDKTESYTCITKNFILLKKRRYTTILMIQDTDYIENWNSYFNIKQ